MNTGTKDHKKQIVHLAPPSQEAIGDDRNKNKLITVIIILLCLLFGILLYGVLVILPDRVSTQLTAPAATVDKMSVPITGKPPANNKVAASSLLFKEKAESALTDFLNLQSRLESEKILIWGGQTYKSILSSLLKGDEHFKRHEYESAQKIYNEIATQVKTLSDEKQTIFKNSLAFGNISLEDKKSEEAEVQFTIALAINGDDYSALEGLKRARNLNQVQELLKKGHNLEINNQLDQALDYFRQAHQLDKLSKEAEIAYTKLQAILIERDFKIAIASFYQSLQKQSFKEAEKSLKTATHLRPSDLATKQARDALQLEKQNKHLRELRISGENLSNQEKWPQAIDIYTKALTISPHADFAMRGKENAQNNKLINDKLDVLLHSLPKLQEDPVLKNAEDLLHYCSSLKNIGPKLSAKISALSLAVNNAKKIINVTLFSDNMTDIAIYHVGRLGKFNQKRIDLRPGNYTIVAQKPGYRNTRIEIVLNHKKNKQNFTILCKDPI